MYSNKIRNVLIGVLAVALVDISFLVASDVFLALVGFITYYLCGLLIPYLSNRANTNIQTDNWFFLIPALLFFSLMAYVCATSNPLLVPLHFPNLFIICLVSYFIGFVQFKGRQWRFSIAWSTIIGLYCFLFLPRYEYKRNEKPVVQTNVQQELYTLSGQPIAILPNTSDVVLLDFWFTNCNQCIKKIPSLEKLAESYKNDKRVKVYFIVLGKFNTSEEIIDFNKKHKLKIDILYDKANRFANQFAFNGAPHEVIIYKNKVIATHAGFSTDLALSYVSNTRKIIDSVLPNRN